ncbi:MAG: uroporphyrinogen decarboxylase family protein, partial [Desulfomonilaceae bacterium]
MATMTAKERVKKFMKREPVDTMPIFSGMGMVTVQAINKMGIRFAEVHSSPNYLAQSATLSAEMFGFDSVIVPYDMCTIPEAMGRGCSTYANAEGILYPTVPAKWENLDAVDISPDWVSKARMPVVEDALTKLVSEGKYAVGSWVLGPFTLGGQVIELDLLLKGIKKESDKVHEFMKKMTSV